MGVRNNKSVTDKETIINSEEFKQLLLFNLLNNPESSVYISLMKFHLDTDFPIISMESIINKLTNIEYLTTLFNNSTTNRYSLQSKYYIINRIISNKEHLSLFIKHVDKYIINDKIHQLLINTIIESYPDMLLDYSNLLSKKQINKLDISEQYKDKLISCKLIETMQ